MDPGAATPPPTRPRLVLGFACSPGAFLFLSYPLWSGTGNPFTALSYPAGLALREASIGAISLPLLVVAMALVAAAVLHPAKASIRRCAHGALACYWLWSVCLLGVPV